MSVSVRVCACSGTDLPRKFHEKNTDAKVCVGLCTFVCVCLLIWLGIRGLQICSFCKVLSLYMCMYILKIHMYSCKCTLVYVQIYVHGVLPKHMGLRIHIILICVCYAHMFLQ